MRQKNTITIETEAENERALREIEVLMNKGEANLSKAENDHLRNMALAVQAFEQSYYRLKKPATLEAMIILRMYELQLKQKDLAQRLDISPAKLSLILKGKQRPDVNFLKNLYRKLQIPADFILQHI